MNNAGGTQPPGVVLGVKLGPQHDTGAAVLVDQGDQLSCVALSEERLTRDKQSREFPRLSIEACLAAADLQLSDVDLVCIDKLAPETYTSNHRPVASVDATLWTAEEVEFFSAFEPDQTQVVNHHFAHAATAFCVHQLPHAACLIVDGSGTVYPLDESTDRFIDLGELDKTAQIPFRYRERRAETQSVFEASRKPDGTVSITRQAVSTRSGCGHFYTYFTRHGLGFDHLQEGKSMGLAAWGNHELAANFPTMPSSVHQGIDTLMLEHLKEISFDFRKRPPNLPATDDYFAAMARWMQDVLGEAMLHLSRYSLAQCASDNLCLAGGVSLNVVNNRIIFETLRGEQRLNEMFVQPAASDAGMPLGAALYGYYCLGGGRSPFQKNIVYLGPEREPSQGEQLLIEHGGRLSNCLAADVADLLLNEKIVGWVQGRSEYGPRALGSRSILCWPRPDGMKDHLNLRVKHREAFRPFAPIISEARAHEVFDANFPVPYMLFNTQIKPEFLSRLPAVAHVDGSGRLQTVSPERTPQLHELLEEVYRRDDVGVLLNTSFNDAGEPIVETPQHALDCYERTGLDALVVGNAILVRN